MIKPEQRCKRCNGVLRSEESIKRGYGRKCMQIVELYTKEKKKISELDFINIEIKTIKRELKIIKVSGVISTEDPIERIKKEETDKILEPIIHKARMAFQECISELRGVLEKRKLELEKEEVK